MDAIDIIPTAIELARELARQRPLDIRYDVSDICELPRSGRRYDMIVDSYCLQCIVTDEDRESLFAAVRARAKLQGYFLISTAMFDETSFQEDDWSSDAETGVTYHRYGDGVIDAKTGIAYRRLPEFPQEYEDTISICGSPYLPSRRHLKRSALRKELEDAEFSVMFQDEEPDGDLICTRSE